MATEDNFIVAIELGSSKVTGVAGRKQPDGAIQVLAFAQEPSTTFIRKGRINNVSKMTQCIISMREKLEQKMQKSISRVYVGIGGMGMHTVANTVARHFDSKVEITQEMVDAISDENRTSASADRDILESVPQEYHLGAQTTIDPVGILADSIEGHYLNIVANSSVREEIRNCFRTAGVTIADLPITVQALAASAAAALLVGTRSPRCRIACHRNSQLMFHGVFTTVFDGGAQKFSDTAGALEKSNEQIRSALLSRTQTPPALIAQWFAEGREGWVTANEALEWGIVDEVIDIDAAPKSESSQTFLNQLKTHPAMNLNTLKRLFLKNEAEDPEKKPIEGEAEDPEKKPGEGEGTDPEKKPIEGEGEDPEKKPGEGTPEDPEKKPIEGEGEDPEKKPGEGEESDPEEEIVELKAALGKLQETVAALERQLSDAKGTNARLTAGLRTTSASHTHSAPATFDDAIRDLRRDNPGWSYNDAFVQAAKLFPRLWKQKMSR